MGILNATPDSFYAQSRYNTKNEALRRADEIISQGGKIIDIGAYSSRPGAADVTPDEEFNRLAQTVPYIRKKFPEVIISIDTFRASVAAKAVNDFEVDIINDISGGQADTTMYETIGKLHVPYIMMHTQGMPQTMQQNPHYEDVIKEISDFFIHNISQLRSHGVADIIIDPGFGFGKTIEHNYQLLSKLDSFSIFELPILVGVSRKSMIYNALQIKPQDAKNGTTVLNTVALIGGAKILRVHDVRQATETVELIRRVHQE